MALSGGDLPYPTERRWPWWAFVAVTVTYVGLAEFGMLLRLPPTMVATFWPAAGLGAATASFCPKRQWPVLLAALFAGCVLGDLRFDPIAPNLGYAVANCFESFGFAFVLRTWYARTRGNGQGTAARVLVMAGVAVAAATASGVIGAAVTTAAFGGDFLSGWRTWISGDATAIILALPIASHLREHHRLSRATWSELLGALCALGGITAMLLFGPSPSNLAYLHYLVLPPLLWVAIRVGPRETAWSVGLFGVAMMFATANGYGPWATGHIVLSDSVLAAQVFLVSAVLSAMTVARSVEDRKRSNARRLETERALADRERELAALAAERERQQLEAQLLQSQRLEALGRLAGGVAHDFNNLLGVIRNYATLVARRSDIATEVRSDVEHIEHAASRGAELTRELLLFSRGDPEAGGTADAAEVAKAVASMLSRSLG